MPVIGNVNQIKEFGIDIEIDDFGTGHASIVSLLKLKPRRPEDRPPADRADYELGEATPSGAIDHPDWQIARD